jgi:hypothetical protein
MTYFGYRYCADGKYYPAITLESPEAVARFIRDNLEAPQLIITDAQDQ